MQSTQKPDASNSWDRRVSKETDLQCDILFENAAKFLNNEYEQQDCWLESQLDLTHRSAVC